MQEVGEENEVKESKSSKQKLDQAESVVGRSYRTHSIVRRRRASWVTDRTSIVVRATRLLNIAIVERCFFIRSTTTYAPLCTAAPPPPGWAGRGKMVQYNTENTGKTGNTKFLEKQELITEGPIVIR